MTFPPQAEASHLGSSTQSAGSAPPPAATAIQSFQPDLFTGRATTSIPIAVPPGRKGVQPSLALSYSSSSRNGLAGVGWMLELGGIERSTKNGVPNYDGSDTFTLAFQGVQSDLVQIPDGTYRMEDEGAFVRIVNNGAGGWEVRDKSGTRYLFGQTSASQIENGGQVFRWALDKVMDLTGNSMALTYLNDQNQLYPLQILYTAHEPTALASANQVDFIYEDRSDIETSYRSGFAVTTAQRLKQVETKATVNGTLQLARRHDLAYTQSQRTSRSLLTSVTQVGTDGLTTLPPATLTYQDTGAAGYSMLTNYLPPPSVAGWNVRAANLDTGHENWGCAHPYLGLPWGSPIQATGGFSVGGISGSVSGNGDINMSGGQDQFGHAWTYVYVNTPQTLSVSLSSSGDSDSCLWQEDAGGVQKIGSAGQVSSVSLQSGWSILHVTSYHQHQGWGPVTFGGGIKNQLDSWGGIMNPTQIPLGIPQLTGDVDGNATSDLVKFDPTTSTWTVSCATSCTIGGKGSGTWLTGFGTATSLPLLGDWNGDGKTDVAIFNSDLNNLWQFATSTGSSFTANNPSQVAFAAGTPLTGDFNGDGLTDIATYDPNQLLRVALNTPSGFVEASGFWLYWGTGMTNVKLLTGDWNGDGLTDIGLTDVTGVVLIRYSTGMTWTGQQGGMGSFGAGSSLTTADLNGDGRSDLTFYEKSTGQIRYAVAIWATASASQFLDAGALSITFTLVGPNDELQVGDFNGDGIADPAVFNMLSGSSELGLSSLTNADGSNGTAADVLRTIDNGLGGATTINYQPSTQCVSNQNLPFVVHVVQSAMASDGMGNTYTTTYLLSNGLYDVLTKEFRGFAQAKVFDVDGNVSITDFHQDAQKKGRPFRSQFLDQYNALWTQTDQTWGCVDPYAGVPCTDPATQVFFVHLDQTDAYSYDGDPTAKHVRSRVQYDAYGNATRADEDGDVDVPGDERAGVTTFVYNTTAWILNKPQLTQALDAAGTVVAQKRFYYDGANDPATPPTVGLLTKEEEWLVEDIQNPSNEQWLPTTLSYDAYGNVQTVTDALGRATTNTYDAATGTYLETITNVLNHTRTLTYDPRFGAVLTSTDQNTVTTTTEYDALGRVSKVIGPNDTSALPTIRYDYDPCVTSGQPCPAPIHTIVHARIQSGQPQELDTYTFTDGLGRTLQTRSPAEDPAKQVVAGGVEFNTKGQVIKQWVPYYDTFSTSYVPVSQISGLAPPVQYTYDVLGRALTVTDPDGSVTSTTYSDWVVTVTDALNHQTRRTSDAYGRLITVEEFENAQIYTTRYQHDSRNNLMTVTDHAGHLTTATYDSLSRKRTLNDPDMGSWTYVYDAVDNLLTQTDARGVVTTFQYDVLNRLQQKSYSVPGGSGISDPGTIAYTYDDANTQTQLYAKGRLTDVADAPGASRFEYDNQGRLVQETRTVDGTPHVIQRAYDLLGRLMTLTYPDGDVVSYTYNNQGGIETIGFQSTVYGPQTIVTNVDYNAAGQITTIVYASGVVTDYSYDPLTLRLDTLQSTGPAGLLQQFQYDFDAVGNVAQITDTVHTGTQTFGYDELNRLTLATGSYGAFTYGYDPLGNMLQKEGVAMLYGEGGAPPHAVTSTSDGWTMSYDVNGNLLEKQSTTSSVLASIFSYDAENRLVQADTPQEQTVSVTFAPGWNFFALPVLPEDASVAALLPNFTTDFEQLVKRDSGTGAFAHYVGISKFDDFTTLTYGEGYQIYCTNPNGVTLSFTGKTPTKTLTQPASPGWHLLPGLGLQQWTLPTAFNGLAYNLILAYDTASGSLTTATQAEMGVSYYVEVATSSTWTPPLPADVTTAFVYDGDGGRIKQTTASGTTTFLGESLELDPAGVLTKYVFAGSQRIASVKPASGGSAALPAPKRWYARLWDGLVGFVGGDVAEAATGLTIQYYHGDHLGSSNLVTDQTGAVVQQLEYTPYGAVSVNTGSVEVAHKFTGQRDDASTGLYFYHARYYDPHLGRFTTPDTLVQAPSDPQSLNRYAYARNNPVKYVDPSGHFFFLAALFGVLFSALSAIVSAVGSFLAAGISFLSSTLATGLGALQAGFGAVSSFAIAHPVWTGAIIGGLQGGASAYQAGGNIFAGIAFGATLGAVGGYLGGAVNGALGIESTILRGTLQGAFTGAATGATTGFAGGKGSVSDVAKGLAAGALHGAVVGGVTGAVHRALVLPPDKGAQVDWVSLAASSGSKAAKLALAIKPVAGLISGAVGGAVGGALSGGDSRAISAGALIGGAFGFLTSGVKLGVSKTQPTEFIDGTLTIKTVGHKTQIYGLQFSAPPLGGHIEATSGQISVIPLDPDFTDTAWWGPPR